jgi:hypothetical protein
MLPMKQNTTNSNAASGSGEFTTTSAPEAVPVSAQPNEPEFYSMPSSGQTLLGLRRGAIYCLWKDGAIETISVRREGKGRGRRLIVGSTLRNFLRRLRSEQCASAGKERAE